jgi:hypothetical protein
VTATVAANAGLVPAVLVGILSWGIPALYLDEARLMASRDRPTITRCLLLVAWSPVVGAGTLLATWALLAVMALVFPSGWTGLGRPMTALLASMTTVMAWVVPVSGPTERDRDMVPKIRVLSVLVRVTAAGVLMAVLAPLLFSPHPLWFGVGAITATVVGLVVGFFLDFVIEDLVALPLCRVVLMLAGEPDPWRRGLLRFAADRSLLSFVDTEYRFVHLLVRDHLAACDPAALAAAVSTRRDQLAQRT